MKLKIRKVKTSEMSEEEKKRLLWQIFDLVLAQNRNFKNILEAKVQKNDPLNKGRVGQRIRNLGRSTDPCG